MSSYFDNLSRRVGEASKQHPRITFYTDDAFLRAVAEIEKEMIEDIRAITSDYEFPEHLRDKADEIIADWHILNSNKAKDMALVLRLSELVEKMHNHFHDVGSSRIATRWGRLSDNPRDMMARLNEWEEEQS